MTVRSELTGFRMWARVEQDELEEFLATVTAVPENGDPALVRELCELSPSRELALGTIDGLLRKMAGIVAANDGCVTDVETRGLDELKA